MPVTDETPRQRGQEAIERSRSGVAPHQAEEGPVEGDKPALSKTRRKQAMHALQQLGEALVGLSASRLELLALPEQLSEAIAQAKRLNGREARRRQMQFIGRLMREVDPKPIEAQIARWRAPVNAEKARVASVERWRARLLTERGALDELCEKLPGAQRETLEALVSRAAAERARGTTPHAYRELFRVLNALLCASA